MTMEETPPRGRGRPRKLKEPKLAAHRPPVPFVNDPDRFAVVLTNVFETLSTTVKNGKVRHGLKATHARAMAAVIFDPSSRSTIAVVPKIGWDAKEWDIVRKLEKQGAVEKPEGTFLRMEMRPDLDRIGRMTATDLKNADARFRGKIKDLETDDEGKAWATLCGASLLELRATDPLIRMGARMQLFYRGWPPAVLDMLAECFFAI